MYATKGTAAYLQEHGFEATEVSWPEEGELDVLKLVKEGLVDFIINIPKNARSKELTRGYKTRQAAIQFNCSIMTNMEKVTAFIQAMTHCPNFVKNHELQALPPYRS